MKDYAQGAMSCTVLSKEQLVFLRTLQKIFANRGNSRGCNSVNVNTWTNTVDQRGSLWTLRMSSRLDIGRGDCRRKAPEDAGDWHGNQIRKKVARTTLEGLEATQQAHGHDMSLNFELKKMALEVWRNNKLVPLLATVQGC